jgi:hypothetical protein
MGPISPSGGNTMKGATAGPSTVPRPKAEAITASAGVRSSGVVRSAT